MSVSEAEVKAAAKALYDRESERDNPWSWVYSRRVYMEDARAALTAAASARWRPIEEAPRDGTLILVCWAGSGIHPIVSRWLISGRRWTHPFSVEPLPPTNWQPLPSPPETER